MIVVRNDKIVIGKSINTVTRSNWNQKVKTVLANSQITNIVSHAQMKQGMNSETFILV